MRPATVLFLLALTAAPPIVGLLAPGAAAHLAARLSDLGAAGAALLFVAQMLVAAFGVLPASGIGVAAGVLLGPVSGFLVAAAGTLAGALLTFGLARRVLGERAVARLGGRRLVALDGALAAEGWRLVCLIRLSPVMPFAPTSLALGASGVRLRDYCLGTLAALPALFAYVALGALGRDGGLALSGAGPAEWLRLAVLAAGLLATLVLTLRLRRLLGRVLPPGRVPT